MASPVIRCSCPHCGSAFGLKDQALVGKRIRCPKCQKPFQVEAPAAEEEEIEELPLKAAVKAASKPTPPPAEEEEIEELPLKSAVKAAGKTSPPPLRADREDRVQAGPPPKKKKPLAEDEEDDRPQKKKEKKKPQRSVLVPWLLIGGGSTLLLAAVIILVVVLNSKEPDRRRPEGGGPGPIAKNDGDGGRKQGDPEELRVDVGGAWPNADIAVKGLEAPPDAVLTVRVILAGGAVRKGGKAAADSISAIQKELVKLAGPGVGYTSGSDDEPNGENRRMAMNLRPCREDAQAFAKKIAFGTVRSVEGRVITLVVRKDRAPGPLGEKGGDGGEKQSGASEEQRADVGGAWPVPRKKLPGIDAGPDTTLTVRILLIGGGWKKYGKPAIETLRGIRERIMALAGPGVGEVGKSEDEPNGENRRETMLLGPYKENAQAFAKRIDFGTVRSVEGRIITMVVHKDRAPAPLAKKSGDGGDRKQGDPAELAVDISGKWHNPHDANDADTQPPEGTLNVRVLLSGMSTKFNAQLTTACALAITNRLLALSSNPKGGQVTLRFDEPNGFNHRMTCYLLEARGDPQAFADKIDFGTVRRVQGRVITVVVRQGRVPGVPGGGKLGDPSGGAPDLAGPWPPVFLPPGVKTTPDKILFIRVLIAGDSGIKSGDAILKTEKGIKDEIRALAGSPDVVKGNANSADELKGENRRMVLVLAPITEDAQAFAKRIDFGTVHSVEGRIITVIVRKGKEPAP